MYRTLVLLVSIIYAVNAAPALISVAVKPEGRIAHGHLESIENVPFIVSLKVDWSFCNGFIYNERIVITNAHCTDDYPQSSLEIVAGTSKIYESGLNGMVVKKVAKIARISTHPDPAYTFQDLAIVLLDSPLEFGPNIQPIEVIGQSVEIPAGESGLIAGWGRTIESDRPQELSAANITILDNPDCYSPSGFSDNMVCGIGSNDEAPCTYDAGGPLVVGNVVVGTSYRYDCGFPGDASGFLKLSAVSDLIKSKAQELLSES